jgi:hypothetical protein
LEAVAVIGWHCLSKSGGGGNRTRVDVASNDLAGVTYEDGHRSQSAHGQQPCGRATHMAAQADNLLMLSERWFDLPEYIQQSIMALLDAAGPASKQR